MPGAEPKITAAVARSLSEDFPYILAYRSLVDSGYHFLASMTPIPALTPAEFVKRLPEAAKRDLMEWNQDITPEKMADNILSRRTDICARA